MELDEAIARAQSGGSLLFLGAGFSLGASTLCEELAYRVPTAQQFSDHLARKLKLPSTYPLPVVSRSFEKREGEIGLINELINAFSVTECQEYHVKIASLPWNRVYTTNYDNLFEFASQSSTPWLPVTLNDPPLSKKHRCVHINGHISNLNIHTLKSQVKLTHTSYSTDSFAEHPWAAQLRAEDRKSVV